MKWVFQTLWDGLKRHILWRKLAVTDIQQVYRRSLLGMAWIAFSFALFVGVKILIFGAIAPVDPGEFAIWLTVGFWIWMYIQASVIDGCITFINARPWIIGTNTPLSVYVYQTSTRVLINTLFSLPIVMAVLLFYKWPLTVNALWVIPGFLALIANGLWVQILFGSICAQYRDVYHFVGSMMRVMFFLTPILFMPEQLGDKAYLLNYNPFTHYLAIIREPIFSHQLPILSWQVVGSITLLGWILALMAFRKIGPYVAFRV